VTIGGSIALIIIGAILRFAITWTPQYVDIQAMGVILMLGGLVGLAISLSLYFTRRRSQGTTQITEHRRYIEPPP
jgi:membrane-bound ClpP family serine protease